MKVLELIEALKEAPSNAEVYVWDNETNTACHASLEICDDEVLVTSPEMC